MVVLLTILKILACLLLCILLIALIAVLLLLFVPFRYSFSGRVEDPEGSTEILHLDVKKSLMFAGDVRWLAGALHVSAAYDGQRRFKVSLFGVSIPVEKLMKRKGKKPEEKKEAPPEQKEKKGIPERIEAVLNRVERIYVRVEDALEVLGSQYGTFVRQIIFTRLTNLFEKILPSRWGLTGVLGLGDPARSAGVYAVQGVLYPLTAGHVALDTDFELYRYDLQGAALGSVRLGSFVYTGVRLILNRDVRRLLRRLRRGPAAGNRDKIKAGHKYTTRA